MNYTVKHFQCPDQTVSGFLPGTPAHVETLVLQVFRAAWIRNDLTYPYVCLASHEEATRLGWLEPNGFSTSEYRLTSAALEKLHDVYGR